VASFYSSRILELHINKRIFIIIITYFKREVVAPNFFPDLDKTLEFFSFQYSNLQKKIRNLVLSY